MAGDLKVLVEELAKVRGQIGVAKARLLKAKEKERELLLEILGRAVNVTFIPLAQSEPLNESALDAANIQGLN